MNAHTDGVVIKLKVGLEIALFIKLGHFNGIVLIEISLQCAFLLSYMCYTLSQIPL